MSEIDPDGGPLLIVFGGAPGTGKTTLSRRLAAELRLPRLCADAIGHTIRASKALADPTINTQWIAHDVLFQLSEELLQTGVSAILDLNLGGISSGRSSTGYAPATRRRAYCRSCCAAHARSASRASASAMRAIPATRAIPRSSSPTR